MPTTVLVCASLAVWAAPSSARACSQVPPEPQQPCETIHLYQPAAEFPQNLEDRLRVAFAQFDSGGGRNTPPEDRFDELAPLVVQRQVDSAWEDVAFDLVAEEELVSGARHLQLTDPVPGSYRVVWSGSTCAEPEAEDGSGPVVASFTMTDRVDYPASLAALELDFAVLDQAYETPEDSLCETETVNAVVGRLEVIARLPDDWAPWVSSLTLALEVDDVSRPVDGDSAFDGELSAHFDGLCHSDDPRAADFLNSWRPFAADHRVRLVGYLDDYEALVSDEALFTVPCPSPAAPEVGNDGGLNPGPELRDDRSHAGACAVVGPSERRSLAPVCLGLLLVAGLRRRRRA